MRDRQLWMDRIARTISRCILNFEVPPILHFLLLFLTLAHTCYALSLSTSRIYNLIKWFEFSAFLPHKVIVFGLIGPTLITTVLIILQFVWVHNDISIKTSVCKHYAIKVPMILAFILCFGFLQPAVASSAVLLTTGDSIGAAFGGALIGFLCFNVYVFVLMLINLSPMEDRTYAWVSYPNSLVLLYFLRPFLAFVGAVAPKAIPLFSYIFVLPLLLLLFKFPILTWRYNTANQFLMCTVIFWMILTIAEHINQSSVPIPVYLLGIPVFCVFCKYLLHKRLVYGLTTKKITIFKCKVLTYLVWNIEKN